MRFGFVTCVQLGYSCLEEIYSLGGTVDALFTLEDDQAKAKSGRVYLDGFAARNNVPLRKFRHINDRESIDAIKAADLDWLFIIGWSQIASAEVLAATGSGVIGAHPTLLPQGRGRASVPWAILKGLERTGVTLFQLDEGVDTGPILEQVQIELGEREDAGSLYSKVQEAHRELIRRAWPALERGAATPVMQDESLASVWPGRNPSDGQIDPSVMTVSEVDRLVRATTRPYPGAFIWTASGPVTIWSGQIPAPGREVPAMRLDLVDGCYWATEHEARAISNAVGRRCK